jgi:hypothetical protein
LAPTITAPVVSVIIPASELLLIWLRQTVGKDVKRTARETILRNGVRKLRLCVLFMVDISLDNFVYLDFKGSFRKSKRFIYYGEYLHPAPVEAWFHSSDSMS